MLPNTSRADHHPPHVDIEATPSWRAAHYIPHGLTEESGYISSAAVRHAARTSPAAFAGSIWICRQRYLVYARRYSGAVAAVAPSTSVYCFEATPEVAAATVWSPITSFCALAARSSTPSKGGSLPCLTCQGIADLLIQVQRHGKP